MRCVTRRPAPPASHPRLSAFHSTPIRAPNFVRPHAPARFYALDPPLANEEVRIKHLPRDKRPEHWKAKLGSQSEAIIKAERQPDKTPEELRRQGYQNLKHREFEDMTSPSGRKNPSAHKVTAANNATKRGEASTNVMGMGSKETPDQKVRSEARADKTQARAAHAKKDADSGTHTRRQAKEEAAPADHSKLNALPHATVASPGSNEAYANAAAAHTLHAGATGEAPHARSEAAGYRTAQRGPSAQHKATHNDQPHKTTHTTETERKRAAAARDYASKSEGGKPAAGGGERRGAKKEAPREEEGAKGKRVAKANRGLMDTPAASPS